MFSGIGAGLNELIALAGEWPCLARLPTYGMVDTMAILIEYVGTAEVVPIKDRGKYVGLVVLTILPFCPSVLYAQLIAEASNWRYNGILVGIW